MVDDNGGVVIVPVMVVAVVLVVRKGEYCYCIVFFLCYLYHYIAVNTSIKTIIVIIIPTHSTS